METLQTFWYNEHVAGFRRLFYLVSPNETSFEMGKEVPEYVNQAGPYFFTCILLENLILLIQGKSRVRTNDGLNSVAHGIISTFHNLLILSTEVAAYIWVYDNWRLTSLPWDNAVTWVIAMLGMDLAYYWVHRCGHEINIFWAGHQTHHSSEDYNLTTALRQSATQKYFSWMFYMPMALFLPPSCFLVHSQLNLLYQFWIHTEIVDRLGPLEYILNTPSHHRVHHGRNPYCIDKNYAGVLIIWDRMFGTFQAEEEKVVYGLVHPLDTWDPIYGQACHFLHIFKTAMAHKGLVNKVSALVKGPGWEPGKPRLGLREDLPKVSHPVDKYDSCLPWWGNVYVWVHFLLILTAHSILALNRHAVGAVRLVMYIIFALFSLTTFGALFDNKRYGPAMECARCVVTLALTQAYQPISLQLNWVTALHAFYFLSAAFWAVITVSRFQFRVYKKKAV